MRQASEGEAPGGVPVPHCPSNQRIDARTGQLLPNSDFLLNLIWPIVPLLSPGQLRCLLAPQESLMKRILSLEQPLKEL